MVEAALSAASTTADGARAVALQLREKDLSARDLYELARALREISTRYGSSLLVNDRVDVAIAAEADGVHLSGTSIDVADARLALGSHRLIGVSTHTSVEVVGANEAGADFAVFGPVFDPLSKAAFGPARGVAEFAAAGRAGGAMPVLALGGITAERIVELGRTLTLFERRRPAGVSVIGAVMGADDPGAATRALLIALASW